jgi:hypothetical protein
MVLSEDVISQELTVLIARVASMGSPPCSKSCSVARVPHPRPQRSASRLRRAILASSTRRFVTLATEHLRTVGTICYKTAPITDGSSVNKLRGKDIEKMSGLFEISH